MSNAKISAAVWGAILLVALALFVAVIYDHNSRVVQAQSAVPKATVLCQPMGSQTIYMELRELRAYGQDGFYHAQDMSNNTWLLPIAQCIIRYN